MRVASVLSSLGCIFALSGVAAGAFGAHALRDALPGSLLGIFETGVRYQMYHAFALLATAVVAVRRPTRLVAAVGGLFAAGIAIFSGSLYLLSTTGILWLGAITPIGGVAFLAGWSLLAIEGARALAQGPTRWQ
jgi:uncharacterized membrane protein YgdD (TMEM256/DUF423 family)